MKHHQTAKILKLRPLEDADDVKPVERQELVERLIEGGERIRKQTRHEHILYFVTVFFCFFSLLFLMFFSVLMVIKNV